MSQPDDLQAAQARISALEAELAECRASADTVARLRSEVELEAVRHEMKSARELYERNLAALRAEQAAEIELLSRASATHVDIAQVRIQAQLESARSAAMAAQDGSAAELERLQALNTELQAEVDALSTFSRDKALAYYSARVAQEQASVATAAETHQRAKKERSKARAVAQNSGMRTAVEMAAIDAALARAEAEYQRTGEVARECQARLARAQAKLDACQAAR
jgi:hypothetical protein